MNRKILIILTILIMTVSHASDTSSIRLKVNNGEIVKTSLFKIKKELSPVEFDKFKKSY